MCRRALVLLALAGCSKTAPTEPRREASAPPPSVPAAPVASAPLPSAAPATCAVTPPGGVVIRASGKATDVRIASAGGKALVTWLEAVDLTPRPPGYRAYGHVLDGATLGPRVTFEEVDYPDDTITGAVPFANGDALGAVSCFYAAPSGMLWCTRRGADGKTIAKPIDFRLDGQGPLKSMIGAVATPTDTLVFLPLGTFADVLAFSGSMNAKKGRRTLARDDQAQQPHADGIGAVLLGDEVAVVYRNAGAIRTRRVGFDEAWRGKPTVLSRPKTEVGAPVVAARGSDVVALFSERAGKTADWQVYLSTLSGERRLLETGAAQAQGPGIAARDRCFVVSWVEGAGKATRTRLAPLCDGKLDVAHAITLSTDGVEGGRAYLAPDAVVWQELPGGKAELHVAKLACP